MKTNIHMTMFNILIHILKFKYNIQAIYDPCSYPGIQCKFYYNNDLQHNMQNGMQLSGDNVKNMKDKKEKAKANALANINVIEVSFMIFRTGSVLIVGMCEENVLYDIYAFLTQMLKAEFENICQSLITTSMLKDKKKKVRRKVVMIMTTNEPLINAVGSETVTPVPVLEVASSSKKEKEKEKEDEEVIMVSEKKVNRSYNKKKPSL